LVENILALVWYVDDVAGPDDRNPANVSGLGETYEIKDVRLRLARGEIDDDDPVLKRVGVRAAGLGENIENRHVVAKRVTPRLADGADHAHHPGGGLIEKILRLVRYINDVAWLDFRQKLFVPRLQVSAQVDIADMRACFPAMGDANISQVRIRRRPVSRRYYIEKSKPRIERVAAGNADLTHDINGMFRRLARPLRFVVGGILGQFRNHDDIAGMYLRHVCERASLFQESL